MRNGVNEWPYGVWREGIKMVGGADAPSGLLGKMVVCSVFMRCGRCCAGALHWTGKTEDE